jgi:hypothetical protein
MKRKILLPLGLVVLSLFALTAAALTGAHESESAVTLVATVRQATTGLKDVEAAKSAGYGLFHGCVSGPEEGPWVSTLSMAI